MTGRPQVAVGRLWGRMVAAAVTAVQALVLGSHSARRRRQQGQAPGLRLGLRREPGATWSITADKTTSVYRMIRCFWAIFNESAESQRNDFGGKAMAAPDQRSELVRHDRRAYQEALELIALDVAKESELCFGLHSFGNYTQVQVSRHGYNGGDDCGIVLIGCHILDERTVDLDGVYREAFEVAKRGIPRTEVIDADADTHRSELR